MSKTSYFLLFILSATLYQCVPPSNEHLTGVFIDFSNPKIQKLYDLQDRGMSDSLFHYFQSENPTYRYLSAMAFSSIQDTSAVDSLARLLSDPIEEVRVAAAYSLGQIGDPKAEKYLLEKFDRYDDSGIVKYFNSAILEAIGKCGTERLLDPLATISTYRNTDTILLEGQAWGIYRYGLRGITSEESTNKMLEFATDLRTPPSVRFIAANYLSRADISLSEKDVLLAPALPREDDPRIRMALVIALGKTQTQRAANALLYQYNIEQNDGVKINILRALTNVDYLTAKPTVLQALNDPNTSVAKTAAQFFTQNGIPEEATTYWQLAKAPVRTRWEVKTELYGAALKHLPYSFEESRRYLNWELRRLYENSTNPYEKAAALRAMSNYGWNYRYIRDAGYPSDYLPVRTAAVEGLANIARMPNFRSFFSGGNRVRKELSDSFRDAIDNGDVGMMAVAAEVLRDPELSFKNTFDSLAILENALTKLRIPQEIETFNEVSKTLAYFQDTTYTAATPRFTHKIPWKFINDLKDDSRAIIRTSKGDLKLELMPSVAPGTVANFLELVQDKFYNGKNFHRVVPNFVVQGGCPRGDGYGSLNYAIRSELPYLHYDEGGYVGMASAGKHTECTQFFITHSPTPHLDGRYTIFARVVEGMDIVNAISIGDTIEEVVLENPK